MRIRTINLYDPEIESLPQYNWHRAQRYLLLDAGIGSNTADILKRVSGITTHIANDRKEDALQEAQNLTLGAFSALEGIDYQSMAFACFVRDVKGVKLPIDSDSDVKKVCEAIKEAELTKFEVQSYLEDLKKKLILP